MYCQKGLDANGIEYVDLGLPSGTLWAKNALENEYKWGEVETTDPFNYKFGEYPNWTKYNATDGLTTLEPEDDAAHVNMGGDWRMPTYDDFIELLENTDIYLYDYDYDRKEKLSYEIKEDGTVSIKNDMTDGAYIRFYNKTSEEYIEWKTYSYRWTSSVYESNQTWLWNFIGTYPELAMEIVPSSDRSSFHQITGVLKK